jgi:hypothetical protein
MISLCLLNVPKNKVGIMVGDCFIKIYQSNTNAFTNAKYLQLASPNNQFF